ncbi:TRAP transporter small permease [Demequina sp. NBRC 110056]|uniref:TRAP transporter small permease n=1 Tax=Demequina sp. NBRC 110056 TaxID=1570345 RepID=UPI00135636EC|nr:TRAP transporter small permease subunit [Demequina sp. NBRC 110056]
MTDDPRREGQPRPVAATLRVLGFLELGIGALSLLTILVLVFFQALQRYLPIDQIAWTGEIARFSLVWLTFAVMGWLVTARGHIALEVVDTLPWPSVVRAAQTLALVVVAATGVGLALEAWALVETQSIIKSPVLRMPMSWVYIPVLFGAAMTVVRALLAAYEVARYGPPPPPEAEQPVSDAQEVAS